MAIQLSGSTIHVTSGKVDGPHVTVSITNPDVLTLVQVRLPAEAAMELADELLREITNIAPQLIVDKAVTIIRDLGENL